MLKRDALDGKEAVGADSEPSIWLTAAQALPKVESACAALVMARD